MAKGNVEGFAFYEQLLYYYKANRRKIRSRYNDLTRKYLAYNDVEENPTAFLRRPQFEALEIYVFLKEFMGNPQVFEMFNDWRKRRNHFADASYYSVERTLMDFAQTPMGYVNLPDAVEKQTDHLFRQMKLYRETYPNYIYALAMGLGKTILMATCIFYEFLLANKYPKEKIYCHNALVFAPDKTVLQSLREIITFNKALVVPPEYAKVLDANIKFHFLDESGASLHTLDDSAFNIIISNTQKIIVKKKRKEDSAAQLLFKSDSLLSSVYGTDGEEEGVITEESELLENQRFKKLCRLTQLGVYVDEAHHLFGADLEKHIRAGTGQRTSLRDTINMLAKSTSIIGCYNYTGTPYVNKQLLPEVVYAYGLRESIQHGYLKDADLKAYENVRSVEFLRGAVTSFWERYGGNTYEGLPPKLAIFAATIAEANNEVRPAVERVLADLGVPANRVLVNVGDDRITKDEDIRNFNDLDVVGTQGSEKQFLILVGKGREGWNCRSLFGVAMFRSPSSRVFVLQATMRCLRQITDEQQTASVFLSKENYDILDAELQKNFNMDIKDLNKKDKKESYRYQVRVLPPPRSIKLKRIWREYRLLEKTYNKPISFKLANFDCTKYASKLFEKDGLSTEMTVKETNVDHLKEQVRFSAFTLAGEIARYMNISPILVARIVKESEDGENGVLDSVNRYNEVLYDVIIPKVFNTLYEVTSELHSEDRDLILLKEPKDAGYYEFSAQPDLVLQYSDEQFRPKDREKSFHADTYCFDSKPEKECFLQYINSKKVNKIYFTGMFTSGQSDLAIQYYDPESKRIRHYYPDFFAEMADGTYELIEVKRDDMIEDTVVHAKSAAALEMAMASGVEYKLYPSSVVMRSRILESSNAAYQAKMFD